MSLIYLGSPYSDPDPAIMQKRYEQVSEVTARLLNTGDIIYSPIAYCHPIAKRYNLPRDSTFWLKHNITFLRYCEGLIVLKLDGWKESVGLKKEIEFAQRIHIPIEYMQYIPLKGGLKDGKT